MILVWSVRGGGARQAGSGRSRVALAADAQVVRHRSQRGCPVGLIRAAVAFGLLMPPVAGATVEVACTFMQPVLAEDQGVRACPVTYTRFGEPHVGWSAQMTVRENCIGTHLGFQDRNAASLARLEVAAEGMSGDTLRVVVDASKAAGEPADARSALLGSPLYDVLAVTRDCMVTNARQEPAVVRYLDIRVVGATDLSAVGGTFAIPGPQGADGP